MVSSTIVEHIAFFGAGISFLVAAGQLCVPYRRIENYNLFALFFIISLVLFQYGFVVNHHAFQKPYFLYFHFTLLYCIGPFLYYAYYLVIRIDETLPKSKLLLLLPALFYGMIDIYFIESASKNQNDILAGIFIGFTSRGHAFVVLN